MECTARHIRQVVVLAPCLFGMAHQVMVTVARRTLLRWVAFDFETSDLSAAKGHIVQIGAADGRESVPPFDALVGLPPGKKMNPYASRANGIMNHTLVDADPFAKEYGRWRHWLQLAASSGKTPSDAKSHIAQVPSPPLLLVAHNAKFDLSFLRAEMLCNEIDASTSLPNVRFADSLPVMRSLNAGVMKNGKHVCKLGTLHERWCGGPIENAHNAMHDAVALARVVCAVPGALEALCRAATDINGNPSPLDVVESDVAEEQMEFIHCVGCGENVSPHFWESHVKNAHGKCGGRD